MANGQGGGRSRREGHRDPRARLGNVNLPMFAAVKDTIAKVFRSSLPREFLIGACSPTTASTAVAKPWWKPELLWEMTCLRRRPAFC
jgi:hypothetical protein